MVELCITCKSTTTVTIYIHLLKIQLCRTGIVTHLPVLLEVLGSVVRKHPSIDVLPVMRFLTTPSSDPQVNFEYATTTCKSKACNKWHARITECGRYRYSSNTNLAYGLMTRQDGWKFGASYFGLEICIELVGHFPGACLIGRALRFHHSGETQGSEIRLIALKLWLRYRRFKLPILHRTIPG